MPVVIVVDVDVVFAVIVVVKFRNDKVREIRIAFVYTRTLGFLKIGLKIPLLRKLLLQVQNKILDSSFIEIIIFRAQKCP